MTSPAIRLPTLRTVGIAGAALGAVGLAAPFFIPPDPVATIDVPAENAMVARCFVAKGRVDPSTIGRPLWLLEAEAGERWREVGRVYPAPGTWGGRVCASGSGLTKVRLALVLVDDDLDAKLAGPPIPEPEEDLPDWLKPGCTTQQQGGCGRRHGFSPLPAGATMVEAVDVRVAAGARFDR